MIRGLTEQNSNSEIPICKSASRRREPAALMDDDVDEDIHPAFDFVLHRDISRDITLAINIARVFLLSRSLLVALSRFDSCYLITLHLLAL